MFCNVLLIENELLLANVLVGKFDTRFCYDRIMFKSSNE